MVRLRWLGTSGAPTTQLLTPWLKLLGTTRRLTRRLQQLDKKKASQARARANEDPAAHQGRLKKQKARILTENNAQPQERLDNMRATKAARPERQPANTARMTDDEFYNYTRVNALDSSPEFWKEIQEILHLSHY